MRAARAGCRVRARRGARGGSSTRGCARCRSTGRVRARPASAAAAVGPSAIDASAPRVCREPARGSRELGRDAACERVGHARQRAPRRRRAGAAAPREGTHLVQLDPRDRAERRVGLGRPEARVEQRRVRRPAPARGRCRRCASPCPEPSAGVWVATSRSLLTAAPDRRCRSPAGAAPRSARRPARERSARRSGLSSRERLLEQCGDARRRRVRCATSATPASAGSGVATTGRPGGEVLVDLHREDALASARCARRGSGPRRRRAGRRAARRRRAAPSRWTFGSAASARDVGARVARSDRADERERPLRTRARQLDQQREVELGLRRSRP